MTDLDPRRYYDEFGEGEWQRLDRDPVTRMEFDQTVATLESYLPSTGRILDAGGGAGRYARWLGARGYTVDLVDGSRTQVRLAADHAPAVASDGQVTFQQGDIRSLPHSTATFDAVCCLGGPISHVIDPGERATAFEELRRVAMPDAPVFISVIGRLAMIRDIIEFSLETNHRLLEPILADGDYTAKRVATLGDGDGWAACHGFRADEFETALQDAGFTVERLIGLENVAFRAKDELSTADADAVESVRTVVQSLREDCTAVDISEHMLAVCRA